MSTFKERLMDEKVELDVKIDKLYDFTISDNFKEIEEIQQSLLIVQLQVMKSYSVILDERLIYVK